MSLTYPEYLALSPYKAHEYFLSTLATTNRDYGYYTDFSKPLSVTEAYAPQLGLLDTILRAEPGKMGERLRWVLKAYPETMLVIPYLVAVHEPVMQVLETDGSKVTERTITFTAESDVEDVVRLCEKTGLLDFLESARVRSMFDYLCGVEVGMDTHARKNRSGTSMEAMVHELATDMAHENGWMEPIPQATAARVECLFGVRVPELSSRRRYDEVLRAGDTEVVVIETNFYGGGGSKLKTVVSEFTDLCRRVDTGAHLNFVWLTDGPGWRSAQVPLLDAFQARVPVFNMQMVNDGYLHAHLRSLAGEEPAEGQPSTDVDAQ